jgi:hypothetical protein
MKPWESPKVQMIMSIFNGTVTAVKPLNIMEVRADGKKV